MQLPSTPRRDPLVPPIAAATGVSDGAPFDPGYLPSTSLSERDLREIAGPFFLSHGGPLTPTLTPAGTRTGPAQPGRMTPEGCSGQSQEAGASYAQWYVGAKQKRISLKTESYQAAREKLRQLESSLARGEENPLPSRTSIGAVSARGCRPRPALGRGSAVHFRARPRPAVRGGPGPYPPPGFERPNRWLEHESGSFRR